MRALTPVAALATLCLAAPAVQADVVLPPVGIAKGFRHTGSKLCAKLGAHHHSAVDSVALAGEDVWLEGKFAYGSISKDLQGEDVTLWVGKRRWREVATVRTNSDGRARFRIPSALLASGRNRFVMVVRGDGTAARGNIWVVTEKAPVVVFDIDGTLTRSDGELIDFTVTGDPIAMRPDADQVAHHWVRSGALPIYLTGRPYMFNRVTREWLRQKGFPPGPVVTTSFVGQGMPSTRGVGAFKRGWLSELFKTTRPTVRAAYGNATTDVCAFADAGIDPTATFIIGKNAGRACNRYAPTVGLTDFSSHLSALGAPPGLTTATPPALSAPAR